jgi:hypothetical protein
LGEALAQLRFRLRGGIRKEDRADAARGRADQHLPERAGPHRVVNGLAGAARAPDARRHREVFACLRVEAAGGVVAGRVDRIGHARAAVQRGACALQPQAALVFGRRDAGGALEHAVEVVRAESRRLR